MSVYSRLYFLVSFDRRSLLPVPYEQHKANSPPAMRYLDDEDRQHAISRQKRSTKLIL
jgi:hypothetical protein